MKRIISVLIATSLLFAGCSENKSVTENEENSVTKTFSETSEIKTSDRTDVFVDDKNESNDSDKKVNEGELPIIKEETSPESNKAEKTTAQIKNTDVSTETKTQVLNTEEEKTTAQVKNTDVSTETKTQTSDTESEKTNALTETQTSVAETEKTTGGVIELPIIPVK